MPTTKMTEEDLKAAPAIADPIIAMVSTKRPPAAVAGVALALAAMAHLAKCGPRAATKLFESFYRDLDRAQGTDTASSDRDEQRARLAGVLGDLKLLSLASFVAADLETRQAMLDAIIDAVTK